MASAVPSSVVDAVLVQSTKMPEDTPKVQGYDFDKGLDLQAVLDSFLTTGFQATQFGRAVEEISWTLADEPIKEDEDDDMRSEEARKKVKTTIFLGYTSNLVSSGVREVIRFLAKHKLVDVIVSSAGGIEEDLIKCMAPTYVGEFYLRGAELRKKGLNRIGNLLVPNDNYCLFEDWMNPLLDKMLAEQKEGKVVWSPSKMIERFGLEINNEESIYYWCAKNKIPVFSPALTDGSIGDMMYFHSYKNPGLVCDIISDIRRINDIAMKARHTGVVILGGGVIKHHIMNANLMRNGSDHTVYINTAQEFDGSDSGASPDEAVSWGKIKGASEPVKVCGEASLLFPLLVAQTFARSVHEKPTASQQ